MSSAYSAFISHRSGHQPLIIRWGPSAGQPSSLQQNGYRVLLNAWKLTPGPHAARQDSRKGILAATLGVVHAG